MVGHEARQPREAGLARMRPQPRPLRAGRREWSPQGRGEPVAAGEIASLIGRQRQGEGRRVGAEQLRRIGQGGRNRRLFPLGARLHGLIGQQRRVGRCEKRIFAHGGGCFARVPGVFGHRRGHRLRGQSPFAGFDRRGDQRADVFARVVVAAGPAPPVHSRSKAPDRRGGQQESHARRAEL